MSFDWKTMLAALLVNAPRIVQDAQKLGGTGAEKKAAAMDLAGVATATAGIVDPAHQPLYDAVTGAASAIIEAEVHAQKAAGKLPSA